MISRSFVYIMELYSRTMLIFDFLESIQSVSYLGGHPISKPQHTACSGATAWNSDSKCSYSMEQWHRPGQIAATIIAEGSCLLQLGPCNLDGWERANCFFQPGLRRMRYNYTGGWNRKRCNPFKELCF